MEETIIYCPDIECDSCVKLISKKLEKTQEVKQYEITSETIKVQSDLDKKNLIKIINDLGFRASTQPFERKTFKERIKHFKENKKAYRMEIHAIKYFFSVLGILLLLQALAYLGLNNHIDMSPYISWMIYSSIAIAVIATAMWHFFIYKIRVTCMVGMMIGMTIGMQTGMMIGAILGATNGFFIGALVGMLVSVAVGVITGQCCGVMGVMEGMMAGVMGGTMGPMISVMMMSDHIEWFMPPYMLINIIITALMIYMVYEESVEGKEVQTRTPDFFYFISLCVLASAAITAIMVFAPKNFLLG
ncbi:MAG: heavy-metal-associated domain-containing protein [Nanoarchaeota archaeon]|nr:heavy-metal-associated domain-containing protein [Nanoarchaeota archaeon]